MKILARGRKSMRDGSPWRVKRWREIPEAPENGKPCGVGLHSFICGDPLKSPKMVFPCEVWEDECEGECGRDEVKARYRRQRILREITGDFKIVRKVNAFVDSLKSVAWLKPALTARGVARRKAYMRVVAYESVSAAWAAAWAAAGAAARAAARAAAGAAYAHIASDLDVDTTWLHRWWGAWEMGFYPIREDGDRLVVGWIKK